MPVGAPAGEHLPEVRDEAGHRAQGGKARGSGTRTPGGVAGGGRGGALVAAASSPGGATG
eukprot:4307066-Pyramimonas_sp.AAC.1